MDLNRNERLRPFILRKENRYLWYALIFPAYLILYFAEEHFIGADGSYWVSYIPLDDKIPFCEYFVIPYDMWAPYIGATGLYLLIREHDNFKKYMTFIAIGFFSISIFYIFFPNGQNLRPETFSRDNICTHIVSMLYAADNNLDVCPSIHVVGAGAAAIGICTSQTIKSRVLKISSVLFSILVSISTTFIKQHSALDVITALPVIAVVFMIVYFPAIVKRKRQKNLN